MKGGKFKAVFSISATLIGTVVGAGFASGQEILQFFTSYGWYGFAGLVLSVLVLGAATNKVFQTGLRLQTDSYREMLLYLLGPRLLPVADFFFLLFFLLLIGVMFAGSGTVFRELNLEYSWGIGLTLLILIMVLRRGLPGLVQVNLVFIPLMCLACLVVASCAAFTRSPVAALTSTQGNWLLAALQFSAYNLILAVPVLLALAKEFPDQGILRLGSWLGSIALGMLALLIHTAIFTHYRYLSHSALPMVVLAKRLNHCIFWGYAFILWGEMLTTLLANVYGLAQRLVVWSKWSLSSWVIVLGIAGIVIAKFGFVKLIAGFYPIYGILSMVLLILIFLKY